MYRSPIRLAGLDVGADFNKQTLSLARKKMLAELELGDGHTIIVNGTELNRQDITHLFDELGNGQHLAWHIAIFNDTVLLHFLENGEIQSNGPGWAQNDIYDTPGFRNFISPYFAAAMSAMFQKSLSGSAGSGMITKFKRQRSFLSSADHETAYARLTRYFLEIKNRIMLCLHRIENRGDAEGDNDYGYPSANTTTTEVTKTEIEALCNDYEIFVLNQMPEEFDDLRYSIVNALNDICVTCDHTKRPVLAYAAISKAAAINCESMRELVQNNKQVVYNKLQPRPQRTTPAPQPQKEQPLRWIGLILFIFITIVRLAGTGGCSKSQQNNFYPSYSTISSSSPDPDAVYKLLPEASEKRMKTYRSLLVALNDLEKNIPAAGHTPDTVIRLARKGKNGDDILAPAWQALSLPAADEAPLTNSASANVLIDNKSDWPAIAVYALDEQYFGSAYVSPHAQYNIRYNTNSVHINICSGDQWSNTVAGDVLSYITDDTTKHVRLMGGFRQHSASVKSVYNSFFYRNKAPQKTYNDAIIINNDKTYGTSFTEEKDSD